MIPNIKVQHPVVPDHADEVVRADCVEGEGGEVHTPLQHITHQQTLINQQTQPQHFIW